MGLYHGVGTIVKEYKTIKPEKYQCPGPGHLRHEAEARVLKWWVCGIARHSLLRMVGRVAVKLMTIDTRD